MTESNEHYSAPGKLALALSKAQGQFPEIPKNKTAKVRMKTGGTYEYKYAGLADILLATRKALSANELAVIQTLNTSGLETHLIHSSGESISSHYRLPHREKPQDFGSELTYGRRYSLCAILGVEGDEDLDGKLSEDPPKAPQQKSLPEKPKQTQERKISGDDKIGSAQFKILMDFLKASDGDYTPNDLQMGCKILFNKNSAKDLTLNEYSSLLSKITKHNAFDFRNLIRFIEEEGNQNEG